jgi:hypothetical protein
MSTVIDLKGNCIKGIVKKKKRTEKEMPGGGQAFDLKQRELKRNGQAGSVPHQTKQRE